MGAGRESTTLFVGLNESPYEKVGKFKNLLSLVRIIGSLNESPYEKVGKSLPETSPQPCGRNGCFARTSRRLHAELYTPTTSTPIKSSDKGRNHASDTPYLRHVPGSRTNKDPRRMLSKATRWGGLHIRHVARFRYTRWASRLGGSAQTARQNPSRPKLSPGEQRN